MKRILFLLPLLLAATLCLSFQAQSPSVVHVTFVLTSPDLPDDTAVYITGSLEQLGSWNPGRVKMESKGNHTWSKEISIDRPLSIEYKYTLGTWEREGANADGSPLPNFVADASHDKAVKDTVLFWTKGARQRVNHGQITGTVRYHRGLKGASLQDRDLVVWLPPGYDADKTRRYPVIYMHDGQNIFDPVTSAFGVDWSVDETADDLIKKKSIEPIIVVGIYNTSDRMKEYTPGDKGTAYMDFVVKTVKPFIDSTYRTKADRRNTIVGGSSAGGIISFMLVWEHPDVFSKAICMSPASSRSPRAAGTTRASSGHLLVSESPSSSTSTTAASASTHNSNPASTTCSPRSSRRSMKREKISCLSEIPRPSTLRQIGPSDFRGRWCKC